MAQRWPSAFLKDGGEIYRVGPKSDRHVVYILARLTPSYCILCRNLNREHVAVDPLQIMFDAHYNHEFYTMLREIDQQQFGVILAMEQSIGDNFIKTLFDTLDDPDKHTRRVLRNGFTAYIKQELPYNVRLWDDTSTVLCEFDIPGISAQQYKYVIYSIHNVWSRERVWANIFIVRGINVYKYIPHVRDVMLLEYELPIALHIDARVILYHMCRFQVNIDEPDCEYYLSVHTNAQLERCFTQLNEMSENCVMLREIFNAKTHEENYAHSVENLFNIVNMPRVLFNIILEYL